MKALKAIWDLMNGGKMKASSMYVFAAVLIRQFMGIDVDLNPDEIAKNVDLVIAGGTYFVGVIHDIYKRFQAAKSKK